MTTPDATPDFEALLDNLQHTRGFDFSGYKRPSLMRRVSKRMEQVGISDYLHYIDYLKVHPEEFTHLFNTVLINVTHFFRDDAAWNFLGEQVLPKLIPSTGALAPLRVWCPGCASGEEAFTIAILLAELLGAEAFLNRVKIYATDVDDQALATARQASYAPEALQAVPERLRNLYFRPVNNRFMFRDDLRRAVIFGRHDLLQDAPISRLDLLICRNTLMYFNFEAQARILRHFHFALEDAGVLFLGRAELLLTHAELFTPLDLCHRVFAKVKG